MHKHMQTYECPYLYQSYFHIHKHFLKNFFVLTFKDYDFIDHMNILDAGSDILGLFRHYLIQEVDQNETINDQVAQNWFKHFKGGFLSLEWMF